MKQPDSDSKYLQLLERKGVKPNFWCSKEYFENAEFKEYAAGNSIWVEDENGQLMFPPLDSRLNCLYSDLPEDKTSIWADFNNIVFTTRLPNAYEFLDYEYIYNPKSFLNMAGKHWSAFRKNCRKYPKRHKGNLQYRAVDPINDIVKISEFFETWLRENSWPEYYDGEVMTKYVLFGQNREALIDSAGDICGLNIWDENYMFVNYRFCLCYDWPFLSEYMRRLFYTHKAEQNKLVNDGGILDRPGLKEFKDKLNPMAVNKIYSWKF